MVKFTPLMTSARASGYWKLTSRKVSSPRGELAADRYESYARLKKEAAHHEMSLVEKRRKDKAFGKFLKTAKEQVRKK